MTVNPYSGREQTEAKHFILRTYLQELAFKVLTFADLTYVDGFSGPWETRTQNFADSSFMIAIEVLKDAQQQLAKRGIRRSIRCFFCERDRESFKQLTTAVSQFHSPADGFLIQTHEGEFTKAVDDIRTYVGNSFALIFIDPTGWTGYGFDVIRPLLIPQKTEVIINYMYDFINRAVNMADPKTIASFDPILGGSGWQERLDPQLAAVDKGMAVERLFRATLKEAGSFQFVVSTKILRPTVDRTHFFLTYGTKKSAGLSTFRETEFKALKKQAADRSNAKERLRELNTGSGDLFAGFDASVQSAGVEGTVVLEKALAREAIIRSLNDGPKLFGSVWASTLEQFTLRVTNVKDICTELAREGLIENTWSVNGLKKPEDSSMLRLRVR